MKLKYIEYKNTINKDKLKIIIGIIALYIGYFIMQLQFLADPWFGTDELDIMMIGKRIAGGELLYVDVCSQHMPFTYYISALFVKLGARSVNEQRIAFYLFFALLWVIMYVRYKNLVGKLTMLLYPVAFCCLTSSYNLGTCILSEHVAGVGFVILFLEFIHYIKYKNVKIDNCIFISLSIVLTFGTVFVGAFGVAIIVLGVFIVEVSEAIHQKKNLLGFVVELFQKLWKLILICVAPFAALTLFYIATGSLDDFIKLAYTDNRTIYASYMDGYGGSILHTIMGVIDTFAATVMSFFKPEGISVSNIIFILAIGCMITFVVNCFRNKENILGIISMLFIIYCGPRGYFNYHGTSFVAVAGFMTAYVFANLMINSKERWRAYSIPKQFATGLFVLVFSLNYLSNFSYLAGLSITAQRDADSVVLEEITEPDEAVVQGVFSLTQLMNADRISTCDAVTTPWTWESVGEKQFERLKQDEPRVAMFAPDFVVWENAQADYAPEFIEYIQENYTHIEGTVYVYARNDYYEEACDKVAYLFEQN